jgi:hypothetical protein
MKGEPGVPGVQAVFPLITGLMFYGSGLTLWP